MGRKATESLDIRLPVTLGAGNSSGTLAHQFGVAKAQRGAGATTVPVPLVAGAVLALQPCGGETPVTAFEKHMLKLWQALALIARTAACLLRRITPLCHMDAAVNPYSTQPLLYGDNRALCS